MLDDMEVAVCEACEVRYGSPECAFCPFFEGYEDLSEEEEMDFEEWD